MNYLWQIIFGLSIFSILHSYVFFPFLIKILGRNKKLNYDNYSIDNQLPNVSIVMAVYNEENIIEKKILSVFTTNYPKNKIKFYIGSDNSKDKTNDIIKKYVEIYPNLHFVDFKERNGKIKIINKLVAQTEDEIIVSTDAKVLFEEDTIFHLIEYFKDSKVGIVGGVLINSKITKQGIAKQEDFFMNREMIIKYNEGLVWGHSIGIYGALYAIRKELWTNVNENLLVDDFFITLKVIEKQKKVIFNPKAKAIENLPTELAEEFKRKVRIATGNFQNVRVFWKLLFNPFSSVSFSYVSHKVLRWFTPFIFAISLVMLLLLFDLLIYKLILFSFILLIFMPIFDFLLKKVGLNINILRLISHFVAMNLALTFGFFKSLKGNKNSIWQPSKRTYFF